jgi:hypothetical protein
MATEFHDCDLFFDFVFLATEVVGDGEVGPRARNSLSLELVEAVGAGVVTRDDFDGLGEVERQGGCDVQTSGQGHRRWWSRGDGGK